MPDFRRPAWLMGLFTAVSALLMAAFAITRHMRLNSSLYDLGIKSQVIWLTSQGDWFGSTVEVTHYLGDHVQFIFLPLALLLRLWPDVRLLLIVQAVVLALGAIPLYRIAQRKLSRPWFPLLIGTIYLLYPLIGFVNRFDFHPVVFSLALFPLAYDLLDSGHPRWATLVTLLILSLREEVGLTLFMFGLYLVLFERPRWRWGALWAGLGLGYSALALGVIIPTFRGETSDSVLRYAWLGDSPSEIIANIFTRPALWLSHLFTPFRLEHILKLFLPLGFLPLFSPFIMGALPALGYNLLSETPSQSAIYFQYFAPAVPFLFLGAIDTLRRLEPFLAQRRYGFELVAGGLVLSTAVAFLWDNPYTTPIRAPYFEVYATEQHIDPAPFRAALAQLPPDASVATMMAFGPHLALRPELHLFLSEARADIRTEGFPQSDYLLLHLDDGRWELNRRLFYPLVERALVLGYRPVLVQNDVVLLAHPRTGHTAVSAETEAQWVGQIIQRTQTLYEAGGKFVPTAPDTLQVAGERWRVAGLPAEAVQLTEPAAFANGLHLLGYELGSGQLVAGGGVCVLLYWQNTAVSPLPDANIFLHLNAADGYVHAQRDGVPVQEFRPLSQWQMGDILTDVRCLQIPPWLQSGDYRLTTGLYDPATGERLTVSGAETPFPNAVELLTFALP